MVRMIHPKRGSKKNRPAPSPLLGTNFTGEVLDISSQGKGVLTHNSGQKIFVSGVWLGEKVEVKITEVKNRAAFAYLINVIEAHPERITPICEYHGLKPNQCGGCPWMFISYQAQLAAKHRRVENTLSSLIATEGVSKPILPSPKQIRYRNRAQLKTDGTKLGFLQNNSHQVVDVEHCQVLTQKTQAQLEGLRKQLPNAAWQPAKAKTLTTIDINQAEFSLNKRLPFAQGNDTQNQNMREWLAQQMALLPTNISVLELFAGSGNFTEVIAKAGVEYCTAVEVVLEATKELVDKQLPNTEVIECDLFDEQALTALAKKVKNTQVLVLDPPRDGFKGLPLLVQKLKKLKHIFYISCDLATFKRDVVAASDLGFDVIQLQPVDLFPQTPHIELLAHLTRK